MVKMRGISKVFRTEFVETIALHELDLDVGQGELVAITGPSGSGKTTALNIAGLLETFTSGTYLLDGVDVADLDDRERTRLRNEKLGFIFQSFNLIPNLDIHDNVEVPLRYRRLSGGERKQRVDQALERVGLFARRRHRPSQLSGGQQQRVAIARAIAGSPELLLADEPTGNLDSETAGEVMQLIRKLNAEGMVVLIVTHDPAIAAQAPRILHIVDGRATERPLTTAPPPAAVEAR